MEPKLSRVYEGAFKRNKIVRNRSNSGELGCLAARVRPPLVAT